jgi:menaquinone-dependent protoporphyrinogen oxidase
MRVLIAYGSRHGHTASIAERIALRLRELGAEVVLTGHPNTENPATFDAAIVGGRVHGSHYPLRVMWFVRRHHRALQSRPSAFFSVSLLQLALDPDRRAKTQGLPARRIISLGWTPQRIEVFAGGLSWKEQYGLLAPIFKRTWRRVLGTRIDPSQAQQVFTDWAEVDRFAQSFFELANGPRTDHTSAAGAAGAYRLR